MLGLFGGLTRLSDCLPPLLPCVEAGNWIKYGHWPSSLAQFFSARLSHCLEDTTHNPRGKVQAGSVPALLSYPVCHSLCLLPCLCCSSDRSVFPLFFFFLHFVSLRILTPNTLYHLETSSHCSIGLSSKREGTKKSQKKDTKQPP